jgi:4,5-DOPA dioxygenase extradiol
MPLQPVIFFGHGSPMNAIEHNQWTNGWQQLVADLTADRRPKAILMISAHWYGPGLKITAQPHPATIHDFGGFPPALFAKQYPAPGDPILAAAIIKQLQPFSVTADQQWGFDHGSWSVLCHAFANADIPLLQLSLDSRQPADWHFALGQKLAFLRQQGVLIAGSGNIVHNLAKIDWQDGPPPPAARQFADFARTALQQRDWQALINYQQQGAAAQFAVPYPDHYLPLLYVLGASTAADPMIITNDALSYGSLDMLSVRFGA